MEPPYQRRSIWNQPYKDFFLDTVLNDYPCPAIFLYESISPEGSAKYSVVDGKQRLLTLFEFANNEFPIYAEATISKHADKYFKDLDDDTKRRFWRYQFAVEFIPTEDEVLINTIFDRINRNVAKLTRQELRHAKFSGEFITKVADLTEWTFSVLPNKFPFIQPTSRKQMKDDELVAQLLLLLEDGPTSYSQDELDAAFSIRDPSWETAGPVEERYRNAITLIRSIVDDPDGTDLARGRLKNQADFYSLVGAVDQVSGRGEAPNVATLRDRLSRFVSAVEDENKRSRFEPAADYFAAARSASNDTGPRQSRIKTLAEVLDGSLALPRL